jgi:ribosomal protein S14
MHQCDKCGRPIGGKVYGNIGALGDDEAREFHAEVVNGEKIGVEVGVYHIPNNRPLDLCGSCFRTIAMEALSKPEPTVYE